MTRRRVLVVDDDDAIREIARMSVEIVGGHQVLTAATGAEGLEIARAERPDLILLDVMMPDLDGPGTVARLQADPSTRDIAVVMLTAKAQPAERARYGRLPGVAGVITKPFDPMTLPQELSDLLGWDGD